MMFVPILLSHFREGDQWDNIFRKKITNFSVTFSAYKTAMQLCGTSISIMSSGARYLDEVEIALSLMSFNEPL